jgi:hypothetical protein
MTITVQSLEDFIAELVAERENIADNIVRWQRNLSAEQKEAISFQVDVWATAVRRKEGEEPWLLEFGQCCGSTSQHSEQGRKVADEMRQQLAAVCEALSLKLRPGKIETF